MNRVIFHIDVNSAFLSWEAAHRLKENINEEVDIRDIPSVIGGDEESRRGIVLAKSYPAKEYGISTGQTLYSAKKLCPNLLVIPPNFKIYKYYSNALFDLLSNYSDKIERYSIDECFMDYTSCIKLFGDPLEMAYKIQQEIKNKLGFSVNIGVSSNKLLAKMAGELEKPNKVNTLFPDELEEKMFPLPISELFMVGKQTQKKLNLYGIKTIGDLKEKDINFLKSKFKEAQGTLLYNYSRGIDNSEVIEKSQTKSIGNSTTLSKDINDAQSINKVLLTLCDSVGRRSRKKKLKGNVINVTIKNKYFISSSHQIKIPFYTNSTDTIYKKSKELFYEFWNKEDIRLIGVTLAGLDSNPANQLSLIETEYEDEKKKKIENVMDSLRENYGEDIIKKASLTKNEHKKITEKLDYFK